MTYQSHRSLQTVVHEAVRRNNIEVLKLLLNHPTLTAATLNARERCYYEGLTPVMLALELRELKHSEMLASDLRVDLDMTYG